MSITPIAPAANTPIQTVSARSASGEVAVRFAPGESSGPLDKVGGGIMSTLKQFEARRTERSQAVAGVVQGPASAIDAAKAELLSGPASVGGLKASGASEAGTVENAMQAMTRSFDYAIETQLIVKTGSQLSTSASSLMRGQ